MPEAGHETLHRALTQMPDAFARRWTVSTSQVTEIVVGFPQQESRARGGAAGADQRSFQQATPTPALAKASATNAPVMPPPTIATSVVSGVRSVSYVCGGSPDSQTGLPIRRVGVLIRAGFFIIRANSGIQAGGRRELVKGGASRRDAEQWIVQGRVTVNGRVINSPALDVTANDVISVDGKPLPPRERTRLFMFHKPRGLMTTHADPEGRPTVFDNLPEGLPRLISIGRLDFNTEGLLLLTNDGGLARALELPDTGWLRRYRVRAHGEVTQAQLDELKKGVEVDGVKYGPIDATLERDQGANVWLVFAIREGKNREVRNVMAHLGLEVNRLIRVSYGPFQLGELAEGEVEEVKTRVLREQLGEKIAALAGADFNRPMQGEPQEKPGTKQVRRRAAKSRSSPPARAA